MVKAGGHKISEYHKAGSSQPFYGLDDLEKSYYKACIWVGLDGVSKAYEDRQGIGGEEAACAKMYSLEIISYVQKSVNSWC